MRKITGVLIIILLSLSCSVQRRTSGSVMAGPEREISVKILKNNNICTKDFFVRKAEIVIRGEGGKQKFLGTFKYKSKGELLLSLRTTTGIEIARIFVNTDSVFINDRINKKLLYGSTGNLTSKYGFGKTVLPVLFGDFIDAGIELEDEIRCSGNKALMDGWAGINRIRYEIDCRQTKVGKATLYEPDGKNNVDVIFSDFTVNESYMYARKILVEDNMKNWVIEIKINSIEILSGEDLEFIPGRNYERILLR
jgi:hypothetical protein